MIKYKKIAISFFFIIVFVLIAVFLTSCLESDLPQYESSYLSGEEDGDFQRSISVTGEGSVKVIADLVLVKISVITEKPSSEDAVAENSDITNELIDILERVDAEYIRVQTSSYNLSPLYSYTKEDEPPEIYAYRVVSAVDVETTDIEKIGEIISLSIDNGANDISSLRFDLSASTKEQAKRDSLKKASLDASAKASAIADALDLTLGNIILIDEGGINYPGPIYTLKSIESSLERDLVPPDIEPQEIEVSSSMSIVYSIGQ